MKHMKKTIFTLLVMTCCALAAPGDSTDTYHRTITALFSITPVSSRTARVEDIMLERENARFELRQGKMQLLSPVNDKTVAVLFRGEGVWHFSPPTAIEREQLMRFYDTDSLVKSFNTLFLLFNDTTLSELEHKLNFESGGDIEDHAKIIDDIFDYLSDEDVNYFKSAVLKFLLDGSNDPYFYAHLYSDQSEPFIFEINPFEYEMVRFMHRAELAHVYKYPEIICQYPAGEEKPGASNDLIRINEFEIDAKIAGNLDFAGRAQLTLTTLKEKQRWLYFNIYHGMEIDSVILNDSIRVGFFKPEDTSVFWVDCGTYYSRDALIKLTVFYRSDDLLERDTRSWIYLRSPLYWYPRYNLWEPARYRLVFQCPSDFTLVSIGDRIDSLQTGDTLTTVWDSGTPVTHAIFNLGYFDRYPVAREGMPPVVILKTAQGLLFRSRDIETEIAEDIMRSIAFYQRLFGEIPFDHLYVSEIPYGLGMAFPGLLNLSWNTFYQTGIRGYDQIFRAHEVAHQWWGIEVGFETYHDQWLSEAFAEFSGLAYLQSVSEDEDLYSDVIEELFELVITNRKYILGKGQEAGPIWLGTRTASTRTEGDYSLVIYKKGALVLRMLQLIMSDPATGSDDRFRSMLQSYYQRFRGKRAGTEDFIRVVSEYMDEDMRWFFDQWVYGTDIPQYEYGYRIDEDPEGNYRLILRVRQEGVPAAFRMPVPVEILFENEELPAYRDYILVDSAYVEQTFTLSAAPDELIFNAGHAVLAEWDESDFEEIR